MCSSRVGASTRRPLVVASIPIKSLEDLETALSISDADYVEIRLDYFDNPSSIDYTVFRGRNVIATLREYSEGGAKIFDPELKKRLIRLWRELGILYDVEISFVERHGIEYEDAIVSIHLFDKPRSLLEIKNSVKKYVDKAFAVKIATTPFKGYKKFLASLLELGDNIAVMPMSTDPVERIAFALLGSKLVYGYVTEPTAKGQMRYRKILEIIKTLFT
ncbi:MAG: type I 3-dehydroquinate dehydratase [Ignisphaera sp.]